MKALVKFGRQNGDVEIREIEKPELGPDQVLLEVKAAGVCGSDLHMWREHQSWVIKLPLVLAMSFVGWWWRLVSASPALNPATG